MNRYFHNLRVRFAECELRQNDVADRAGIARSTMTARMKGYQPFTSKEIVSIAKVLAIPIDRISEYFFTDAPKEYKKRGA